MPRWPKGYKSKHPERNYAKEAKYAALPEQKKRRAARNAARNKAIKEGRVKRGDGKELDHVGSHRTGDLRKVPTRVVSRHANRIRQPKRK
jgi:hypothetical protein